MNSFEQALLRLKQQVGVQTDKDVAEMLGMTTTAFNARKKRDAFPEDKLLAMVARRPDLVVDPQYVLTGMTAKERFAAANGRPPASYQELTEWAIGAKGHVVTNESNRQTSAGLTETDNPVTKSGAVPLIDAERLARIVELLEAFASRAGKRWPAKRLVAVAAEVYNVLADEPALDEPKVERILKLVVNR